MARKSRKEKAKAKTVPAVGERIYRTAIYVRLSSEDDRKVESDTVENQKEFLESFVDGEPTLGLAQVYVDRSVTGTKFDRPEFNRMIADMKAGRIDCIVVKDLSRLGRNYLEAGEYIEKIFPFFGVRFIAVTDNYDSLTSSAAEDGLVVPLKNLINEAYAKDVSKKVYSTYREYKEKGIFTAKTAPYGYRKDPENCRVLLVDEAVKDVVVRIFDEMLSGVSMAQIARNLNADGVLAPKAYWQSVGLLERNGKRNVWEAEAVKRILLNVAYVGDAEIGKTCKCYFKGITKETPVKKEDRILIRNHHPAIIDRESFEKVQQIMKANREKARKKRGYERRTELLQGLVFCGHCRKKMYFYTRKDMTKNGLHEYSIYRCGHAPTAGDEDPVKNIRVDEVEKLALELIRLHIRTFLDAKEELRQLNRQPPVKAAEAAVREKIKVLEERREKTTGYIRNLYQDFVDGIFSETEYLEMKSGYIEELQSLEEELKAAEAETETYGMDYAGDEDMAEMFLRYAGADRLTKELAHAFIRRIYCYGDGRFEVEYRFMDGLESLRELVRKRGEADAGGAAA